MEKLPSEVRVTAPQAILLAKSGYDWPCDYYYPKGSEQPEAGLTNTAAGDVLAPTIYDACNWFAAACGIHIETRYSQILKKKLLAIFAGERWLDLPNLEMPFNTDLEALSMGLNVIFGLVQFTPKEQENEG